MKSQLTMTSWKDINRHRHTEKQLVLLHLKLVDFNHTSQYIIIINTICKVLKHLTEDKIEYFQVFIILCTLYRHFNNYKFLKPNLFKTFWYSS